jgi:hypothetical protein
VVSNLIDKYPDTFAVVEYHVGNDGYDTPWGTARGQFYNIWSDGVPWFAYDGLFDAWPINTYESKFLTRQAIPTPVTLTVEARQIAGDNYRITMRACLEAGGNPLSVRWYAVVVEDHHPPTPTYCRNKFRYAAATSDSTLTPGNCSVETRDITLDPTWIKENLIVIAWVQMPASAYPAEVYQAAKDPWPFGPPVMPGDMNCDGAVNFRDINPFVLALTDPVAWQNQFPGCNIMNGDINGDGAFNFRDINPFVALLSP